MSNLIIVCPACYNLQTADTDEPGHCVYCHESLVVPSTIAVDKLKLIKVEGAVFMEDDRIFFDDQRHAKRRAIV